MWPFFIVLITFWKQSAFRDHCNMCRYNNNHQKKSGIRNCSPRTSNSEKFCMQNLKICSKFIIFQIIIDCQRKTTNLSNKKLLALSSPDSGQYVNQFLDLFIIFFANTRPLKANKPICKNYAEITHIEYPSWEENASCKNDLRTIKLCLKINLGTNI